MSSASPVLVLFRDDLRLADNPALQEAVQSGRPVACLFVRDEPSRPLGGAARWWLHGALASLAQEIAARGGELAFARADALPALLDIIAPSAVYWNRRYGLAERESDAALKSALAERGVAAKSFNGALLHEPWQVLSGRNAPFAVFSPFWRALQALPTPAPLPAPAAIPGFRWPSAQPHLCALDAFQLHPSRPDWSGPLAACWKRSEAAAQARLADFLDEGLPGYAQDRDRPDRPATSRLSPYLRFGQLSPRQIWQSLTLLEQSGASDSSARDFEVFRKELCWREFSYHLLYHHPDLDSRNLQSRFDAFPWRDNPPAFEAWQRGRTGYPIVDAGMRQLWTTGWMHNRVRMLVASFLVKHLLIDWRQGEAWFYDTLVDADPASNTASWQWVAGSGADAAPYFRIFNPILQGEKFDPEGAYVRQYLPELARLPAAYIHKPWEAPVALLEAAGIRLGETYPEPIVAHDVGRQRALAAFQSLKDLS